MAARRRSCGWLTAVAAAVGLIAACAAVEAGGSTLRLAT
jgi:hypothetical protein